MTPSWFHSLSPSSSLTPDDIRLVLAHELAHVKRHDLAWNGLAAIVHSLLYFHPLVWLAHRVARQEQEMACDELAVTRLDIQPHNFGRLLIKIAYQISPTLCPGLAAIGMSGSFKTLSRRLEAMKSIRQLTRRQMLWFAGAIVVLGAVAIVPWRLVAQDGQATSDSK